MSFNLFIIVAFIIWFSSLWISIMTLLSFIGGWKKLSRLYPLTLSSAGVSKVKYSMSSMKMGLVNYRSCSVISLTETGIILEIIKLFSISHKPIFIPYGKITGAEKGKYFFSTYTRFTVDDKKIIVYGKPGDELYSRLIQSQK